MTISLKVTFFYMLGSFASIMLAIITSIWTPFDLLMNERIKMRPGLPPYEWWKTPPDEVYVSVYIFNVTNGDNFLVGNDEKLHMNEIGPIIYLEKLTHSNVTFNDNGTITYISKRHLVFVPEMNHIDLNSTIIVPNWALLGIASYLSSVNFFIKFGFNLLIRTVKPKLFKQLTINDFFWNYTDPMLIATNRMAPHLVPLANLGILARIYMEQTNQVTAFIGTQYGHQRFFLIDKLDGSDFIPHFNQNQECHDRITNATEGVTYPQYLNEKSIIKYWGRPLCKPVELTYTNAICMYGIKSNVYQMKKNNFMRKKPLENDCYRGTPVLVDGLSDVSKCHFDFPIAASFPHFLHGNTVLHQKIDGLKPNETLHQSYVYIEPLTGIPLHGVARSQSNLIIKNMNGFSEQLHKFSDTVLPMFWMEYRQRGLPWYLIGLVYLQVNILPIGQRLFSIIMAILSLILLYYWLKRMRNQRHLLGTQIHFERELFIKHV